MASLSVAEVADFFLRLEDDPDRRSTLELSPFSIFEAAVADGLLDRLDQGTFARFVGKAVQQHLIGFERRHAAVPPPGPVWTAMDFQMHSGYYVTPEGRQLVDLYRRQRRQASDEAERLAPDPRRVMVVHGRDIKARDDLFELLRAFDLEPIEWTQAVAATGTATPYNAEAVNTAFAIAKAAVVLFTPDERVSLREDLRDSADGSQPASAWQPRPNVFFEGGIAFSTHPTRTVVLEHGRTRIPSDLAGRNMVRTSTGGWRRDLAARLKAAGCPVSADEERWIGAGEFAPPRIDQPADADNSEGREALGLAIAPRLRIDGAIVQLPEDREHGEWIARIFNDSPDFAASELHYQASFRDGHSVDVRLDRLGAGEWWRVPLRQIAMPPAGPAHAEHGQGALLRYSDERAIFHYEQEIGFLGRTRPDGSQAPSIEIVCMGEPRRMG